MEEETFEWLFSQFKKTQIKNITFEELNSLFPDNAAIDLSHYYLVEIGHNAHGKRQLVFFKILHQGYQLPLLRGPHQVMGCVQGSWCLFWVNSLTRLKSHFMGMYDRLSFERSTYLIHSSSQKLIRLRCMRHRLSVPKLPLPSSLQIWNDPRATSVMKQDVSSAMAVRTPRPKTLTQRTQRQLKRSVQQMYLSYARDLPEYSREELQEQLSHDISCILYSF